MSHEDRASTARRTMVRQYKEQGPAMGVYRIYSTATTRTGLHASRNVHGAMNRDRFELQLGRHRDALLQHDWDAHGESAMRSIGLAPSATLRQVLPLARTGLVRRNGRAIALTAAGRQRLERAPS